QADTASRRGLILVLGRTRAFVADLTHSLESLCPHQLAPASSSTLKTLIAFLASTSLFWAWRPLIALTTWLYFARRICSSLFTHCLRKLRRRSPSQTRRSCVTVLLSSSSAP